MYPNPHTYVPPPTDGPNTRQREAAGLPLASGTTAPLPQLDYNHAYNSAHAHTPSPYDTWPNEVGNPSLNFSTNSSTPQDHRLYSYQEASTSAAAYYPTPDLAPIEAFDNQRVVSTSSIVDHGSPPLSPNTSQYLAELPEFTVDQSGGPYSNMTPSAFPVTATPSDSGFVTGTVNAQDLPPPVQTMTKEEWLRLGGFLDEPAPTPDLSLGMSRGLSTSTSSSRANWERSSASEYVSAPPPPHGRSAQGGQQVHHYAPADSYSRQDGRIFLRPSGMGTSQRSHHTTQHQPPIPPGPAYDPPQYLQPPAKMLPPPPPPAQFAFDWSQSPLTSSDLYGFPSPASSVPSPAQERKSTSSQASSRRSQARNAPSPTIPARNRPAPYPTSEATATLDPALTTSPVAAETPASAPPLPASAPTPAPAPPAPASSASSSLLADPASILPPPTNTTRKSHSRKASVNHIPRPRNAFILFRSSAVSNNLIPTELGLVDHKNISKVIGEIWRGLGEKERAVWERMAEVEKEDHARRYPGYVYKPKKREVREREKEERKEAARAARAGAKQGGGLRAVAEEGARPSVLDHVPEGWTSTMPRPLPAKAGAVEWDDRRCRAVAQAVLEGEEEGIVAKVEENIAAEASDECEGDEDEGENGGQGGSSQETVKARKQAEPVEQDSNGDILVTPVPRHSARLAHKAAQSTPASAPVVYRLPPLPTSAPPAPSATAATVAPSPPRPKLTSTRSSPADVTTFAHSSTPPSNTITPGARPRPTRRAQTSFDATPGFPSPSSSASSSTASPSSAQRRHGLHTDRYEVPTPTRPHPLAQSHRVPSDNRLQKQQSFAAAGLGIAAPGMGPGAFARGASNWNGSLDPSGSFARFPSLSFQGGFDNSPLLGGGGWGEGGRQSSLGRWELRKASTHISKREALAQQAELEGEGEGEAHARASSAEGEQPWPTPGAGYPAFDPADFLNALDDDAQSMAPSWDSGYEQDHSRAPTQSSHYQSSSSSSYYQPSNSSNLAPHSNGMGKNTLGRTPSFHLGGQEIFTAPVADADALFGAPPPPPSQGAAGEGRSFSNLFG